MDGTVNQAIINLKDETSRLAHLERKEVELFGTRVRRAYRLVSAYAWAIGSSEKRICDFADLLLDLHNAELAGAGGPSSLNGDGAPLQLCITLTTDRPKFRLIADPASDAVALMDRHARAKTTLASVLRLTGTIEMTEPVACLLERIGPKDALQGESFTHGLFWIGASVDSPGVAVYMDTSMHTQEEGWSKVDAWLPLSEATPGTRCIPETVRSCCKISSAGVEGTGSDRYRQKLYIQAIREMPQGLMSSLVPQLDAFARAGCFRMVMGQSSLQLDDIMFNVGMDPVSGGVVDSKIDIWVAGLGISRAALTEAIKQCCSGLGLREIALSKMIRLFDLDYSFLGFGVDKKGRKRLNIYLKGRPE
jgi:hypothetical protein